MVVATMLASHSAVHTWTDKVDRFIALTEFGRRKLIDGGLPADKIVSKPNFVHPDPGYKGGSSDYALFVGRLSTEKGIATLIDAWSQCKFDLSLRIVGNGPLEQELQDLVRRHSHILIEGRRPIGEVYDLMRDAAFLVMPSIWYETFGRTIVEAFAVGTPVIASRLGAMEEIVDDSVTGLHFTPGDAADLAAKILWAIEHPGEMREMGRRARQVYEQKYTPEVNYPQLMAIYESALSENRGA